MSTDVDYFDRLPTCPDCGSILPESWRHEDDRSRWECRHCRQTHDLYEVIR